MLYRIVAITLVALLSLALAGQSIAETKKPPPPPKPTQGQNDPHQQFQQLLDSLSQGKSAPKPDAGPKGVPSGTTSAPPAKVAD